MCVIETRKRVLSNEHFATLTAIDNLAFRFKLQSCNQEALILMQTYVRMQTQVFGRQHPNTESSLRNLVEWEMKSMGKLMLL